MPGAQRDRPTDVLLDLLRSAGRRGQSVRHLLEAGALFGFAENTLRVTLTRLVARGQVESPRRGHYQLAQRTDAVNTFVERWRLGEARVRPWTPGQWLFASGVEAGRWGVEALGFREVSPGLHARPDNLALTLAQLRELLTSLALPAAVPLIAGTPAGDAAPATWLACWNPNALAAHHGDLLQRLNASAARLNNLPRDTARLEAFRLGGEVIHELAKDPLLPAQWLDPAPRAALWQAMLAYDKQGKRIWARPGNEEPNSLPVARAAAATI